MVESAPNVSSDIRAPWYQALRPFSKLVAMRSLTAGNFAAQTH